MSQRTAVTTAITLEYWVGNDIPGVSYENAPVEPEFVDEITIALRSDDAAIVDPRTPLYGGRPQVHLVGTTRALEAFGKYLIALARLETADPDPHEHFESVRNADGGTVHLIVHRT